MGDSRNLRGGRDFIEALRQELDQSPPLTGALDHVLRALGTVAGTEVEFRAGERLPDVAFPSHLIAPVCVAGRPVGFLVMAVPPDFGAGLQEAIEAAAAFIAFERLIHDGIDERRQHDLGELVHDLVTGVDLAHAMGRGVRMGVDLGGRQFVCALTPSSERASEARHHRAVLAAIRSVTADGEPPAAAELSGVLLWLVPGDSDDGPRRLCQAVVDHLRPQGVPVRVGIGPACEHPADYREAARKARWVTEVLEALEGQDVASFDEMGIYGVLFHHEDPALVDEFIDRMLGPLIEHDRQNRTDLVDTLQQLLENGAVVTETAKRMGVHLSTLKYRVQRIERILGVDVRRPETTFNLHLACNLRDIRRQLSNDNIS